MSGHMNGRSQDTDVGVRGVHSLNGEVKTTDLSSDFSLTPGHIDTARDIVGGDGTTEYRDDTGGIRVEGDQQVLETSKMLRYRPGSTLFAGQLVYVRRSTN